MQAHLHVNTHTHTYMCTPLHAYTLTRTHLTTSKKHKPRTINVTFRLLHMLKSTLGWYLERGIITGKFVKTAGKS